MTGKKPLGRPTLFTEELGDEICAEIMSGKSLVRILEKEGMPDARSVYRWLREHEAFCRNYEKAKEDQADYFVEDILKIADEADATNVQVARLRVDTRKWAASKFKPKKYGDRVLQENQALDKDGKPADQPKTEVTNLVLAKLSNEDLEAIIEKQNQDND